MIYDKPLYVRVQETEDKLLLEIKKYIKKHQRPPSVRELTKLTGLGSTSTTHSYLKRLQKKGLVDWLSKEIRTLKVLVS